MSALRLSVLRDLSKMWLRSWQGISHLKKKLLKSSNNYPRESRIYSNYFRRTVTMLRMVCSPERLWVQLTVLLVIRTLSIFLATQSTSHHIRKCHTERHLRESLDMVRASVKCCLLFNLNWLNSISMDNLWDTSHQAPKIILVSNLPLEAQASPKLREFLQSQVTSFLTPTLSYYQCISSRWTKDSRKTLTRMSHIWSLPRCTLTTWSTSPRTPWLLLMPKNLRCLIPSTCYQVVSR